MELITPGIGLLFWMLLAFSIVLIILKKFAWKPILNALKDRQNSIEQALEAAEKAKEQMAKLQADNEKILAEARLERDKLIKEAREMKDQIISDARLRASEEGNKLIEAARSAIQNERTAAVDQIRQMVANLSVDIAQKLLLKQLEDEKSQKELIEKVLNQTKLN
jgi:F-type H+-transporting ATPase subunit b